jgi:hypothetical protein
VLTARKLVQGKRHDLEMCLRGILRGFGLKVGQARSLARARPTGAVLPKTPTRSGDCSMPPSCGRHKHVS